MKPNTKLYLNKLVNRFYWRKQKKTRELVEKRGEMVLNCKYLMLIYVNIFIHLNRFKKIVAMLVINVVLFF